MKEWFERLDSRERMLVMIAGGMVVFMLIIMLGVRPIMNQSTKGQQQVEDKQALLTELDQVAARLGPQSGGAAPTAGNSNQSMVLVVDRTTRSSGLAAYLKRNQPDGESSIRLRFENAPFDDLVQWLNSLESQHGMSISAANIDTGAQTGRVNCNLTLARAGA